jgi:hypothetical protein
MTREQGIEKIKKWSRGEFAFQSIIEIKACAALLCLRHVMMHVATDLERSSYMQLQIGMETNLSSMIRVSNLHATTAAAVKAANLLEWKSLSAIQAAKKRKLIRNVFSEQSTGWLVGRSV